MTLGCRVFFSEFLDEFEEEKERTNWDKIYDKNKIWTAKMLGTGSSRKKKDYGLIGRVGQKFGYYIQAEWMRIDQVWYLWLPEREGWKQQPWKTEVVVEHENDIDNFEYTIFKLGEVSAPLKVGIFYPSESEKESILKAVGVKVEYGELLHKGEYRGTFRTVGDEEHAEIIRLYIEEGLSLEKIAENFNRSSRTPLLHVRKHNRAVERSGFCPTCRRAKTSYEAEIAKKS